MNAQTNHPINNTTDPQFLGPEAGQQANGKVGKAEEPTYDLTATYSPDDNKLRLRSATVPQLFPTPPDLVSVISQIDGPAIKLSDGR